MKSLFLYMLSCSLLVVSCSKSETSTTLINSSVDRDTVYISDELSISEKFYFSINNLSTGHYWEKKGDPDYYYFYRLLFTSVEESSYLFIEEIKIIDDSKFKLIKRSEVNPQVFGLDYYPVSPTLVSWISPTQVRISINEKEYNLDIQTLRSE